MLCLDPALWDIRQAATVRRIIHVQLISHTIGKPKDSRRQDTIRIR